jgi:hypothetical protein
LSAAQILDQGMQSCRLTKKMKLETNRHQAELSAAMITSQALRSVWRPLAQSIQQMS